jgi:molybdate transport system substrate-binding protein
MSVFTGAWRRFAAAGVLAAVAAFPQAARAADVVVVSNQGATPGVREIAAAFERASGHRVTVVQEAGAPLEQRLANGPADLITGNPGQIDDLVKKGRVVAGSAVPFALASLGVSVRAGAPKPDISTVEAYKAALLAAKSIGYSRGCSGTNAAAGIEALGLSAQLKSKTVLVDGGPVVEYLAKGDFEIGIQQTNIMVGAPGTDYVGPPPGALTSPAHRASRC